jgi:hypothetical protein
VFFFEKKDQKTFVPCVALAWATQTARLGETGAHISREPCQNNEVCPLTFKQKAFAAQSCRYAEATAGNGVTLKSPKRCFTCQRSYCICSLSQ